MDSPGETGGGNEIPYCKPRGQKSLAGLRNLTQEDTSALGALFFDAFHDTVDDSGDTEAQFAAKAQAIINGRYGLWLSTASWTFASTGPLMSACLVSNYAPYGCPVIAVIATAPNSKKMGAGHALLCAAVVSLAAQGYRECCAMITVGNTQSARLFASCGFLPIQGDGNI